MSDLIQKIQKLGTLATEHDNQVKEIRSFTSDELTAQGIANERARRIEQLNNSTRDKLAGVREEFASEVASIDSRYERSIIPAADRSTADEWARVQMLLDAGKSFGQIINGANLAQLQAIREWGPTYQESQFIKKAGIPNSIGDAMATAAGGTSTGGYDPQSLYNSVDRRWAELSPKDALFIRERLESFSEKAQFEYSASALEAMTYGGNAGGAMAIAMSAKYAAESNAAQFLDA